MKKVMKAAFDSAFEFREEPTGEWVIKGYALRYNEPTSMGKFDEVIMPGAADGCMGDDVRCLLNHDSNIILGRTTVGSCIIGNDEQGVWYECRLDPTNPQHQSVYASIKRGDISQSSFAFSVGPNGAAMVKDETTGRMVRQISQIAKLYDVSPVVYPAYESTSVEARKKEVQGEARSYLDPEALTEVDMANIVEVHKAYDNLIMALQKAVGETKGRETLEVFANQLSQALYGQEAFEWYTGVEPSSEEGEMEAKHSIPNMELRLRVLQIETLTT